MNRHEVIPELIYSPTEEDLNISDYREILRNVERFVNLSHTIDEKIIAIDYASFVFRMEFTARTRSRIFRWKDPSPLSSVVQTFYYTEDGVEHDTFDGARDVKLDDSVAVCAWRPDRLSRALPIISQHGFTEDKHNHIVSYFKGIDLTVVSQGNHSASVGAFLSSGVVHADCYDLTKMFDHVATDGRHWVNVHTGESLNHVAEVYIALLYTFAAMKHSYQQLNEYSYGSSWIEDRLSKGVPQ